MPIKSKRGDHRGHWPKGKRRNPDAGQWGRTRLALARFLETNYRPGEISARALAADMGLTDRAVRRWINGTGRPDPETQDAVAQWIAEWRAELQRRKTEG